MNKQDLADQEKYLKKCQNEVKAKVAQLDKELLVKTKQAISSTTIGDCHFFSHPRIFEQMS
jgi:hypothetical protein